MKGNFKNCLDHTLIHEGGWSDHPKDPGGATMKGITLATYRQYRPGASKADLRTISDAEVESIYRKGYWDKVRGDDLPAGLDMVAFDAAVNSGPSRGAKWLQGALGVADDGVIGPATIAAASTSDHKQVILDACRNRMNFLRRLDTWPTFGKGWERRVDHVRAQSLVMTQEPDKPKASPSYRKPSLLSIITAFIRHLLGGKK